MITIHPWKHKIQPPSPRGINFTPVKNPWFSHCDRRMRRYLFIFGRAYAAICNSKIELQLIKIDWFCLNCASPLYARIFCVRVLIIDQQKILVYALPIILVALKDIDDELFPLTSMLRLSATVFNALFHRAHTHTHHTL